MRLGVSDKFGPIKSDSKSCKEYEECIMCMESVSKD